MTAKKNVVRVSIVGEDYSIRSDASPEHTRAVAEHVDKTIRQIMHAAGVVERERAAILAALQLTDELLRERAAASAREESLRSLSAEVRRLLPPAKRGDHGGPA